MASFPGRLDPANSRAGEETEARRGSVLYPQTQSQALGKQAWSPRSLKAPCCAPATALCPQSISKGQFPTHFWCSEHPRRAAPQAGPPAEDPREQQEEERGLTLEILLWNLLKLWRASDPAERGSKPVAGDLCPAWGGHEAHSLKVLAPPSWAPHRPPGWRGFFLGDKLERLRLRAEASVSDSSAFSRLWFLSASGQPERQW